MRIRLTIWLLFLYLATTAQIAVPPAAGDGSLVAPYHIASAENLYWLSQTSNQWDKHYIQTEHIDLIAYENLIWIGNDDAFSGSYNGQGFSISNFVLHKPDDWFVGLFGKIIGESNANPVVLKNIVIENADVNGVESVGALVGYVNTAEIHNCKSSGSITGEKLIGGLMGYASQTSGSTIISYCSSSCNVSGNAANKGNNVGGLLGSNLHYAETFEIRNSYATGIVSGYGTVGGFIGYINEGLIINSYSRGDVIKTSGPNNSFGSFVGHTDESNIVNSFSTGQVIYNNSDNPTDKGFAGSESNNPVYSGNFFDSEASQQITGAGATAKTTAEMKTELTFTDAGWDFSGETANGADDYWDISAEENDGYPYLLPMSDPVSSQLPNALNFDGVNDFVGIPIDGNGGVVGDNSVNSSFTMELWFRIPDYANFSTLVSKHSNSGSRKGFFIESNGSGSINAGMANAANSWTVATGTDAVNDNQWHHTAFTYDSATNTLELYIDGILQSSQTGFTPVFDDIVNLRLGSSQYYNSYSEIEIDEFRIWDTLHTACDIQKYMKTELSSIHQNLHVYYRFNEGQPGGNNAGIDAVPNIVSTNHTGFLYYFALSGETSNWISSGADIAGTDEYFDDTPPQITSSHANVSFALGENCQISLPDYIPDVTFTDNCDNNPTISQQPEAGTLVSDTTLVTLTVTDYGDNADEVSFYVEVSDSYAPVIITTINDSLMDAETDCKVFLPDFSNDIEATDNCNIDDLTVEQTPLPGTEISGVDNLITLTVSDRFGNSDQTSFYISVSDTTPPQITSNHNDTIVYAENCQAFLPDYTSLVEAADNCTSVLNITQNPVAGSEIFGTENTVIIQVSDNNGNLSEISFNAAANDTIMPEISCSTNFSIQIEKEETFYEIPNDTLNYVSVNDNCGIVSIYNDFNMTDDLTGAQIPVGNNLISWYVEDEFGNIASNQLSATVYNQWDYYKLEENYELNHQNGFAINTEGGRHTAITENWSTVGLSRDNDLGGHAGAAYIFHNANSDWLPHVKLTASDGQPSDHFGFAVAMNDNFAFIAAPFNDASGNNTGAVYVFQNTDNTWSQTEIVKPENPLADSKFGSSVDVWGDVLIVGAKGQNKAYIFEYSSGHWQQTAVLSSQNHDFFADFGYATAIYGNTAVVGAYIDYSHGSFAGSAFVFEKENDVWQEKAKLISSNIAADNEFGGSVDVFENEIIIGAKKNSENGHYAGMAYVYVKPETGWTDTTETAILQPSDPVADDLFACEVGIYDGRVAIGSELSDPNGMSSGSIYIFDKPLAGWKTMTETQKLTPENNGYGSYFGNSVNICQNFILASAPGAISNQGTNGALFVFSMIKPLYAEQPEDAENICVGTNTVFHTNAEHYDTISWEISYDNGQTFSPVEEGSLFTGYDTPTLSFTASESIDSTLFRCKIENYVHTVYSDTIIFSLDTEAPVIESLEAQVLTADENCSAVLPDYLSQITILDNCDQNINAEQIPVAGTILPSGTYTVTISAYDSQENYSEMLFELIVEDQTAPNISSTHNDLQVGADANCEAFLVDYTGEVTATDNCTEVGNLTITQTPAAGTSIYGATNSVTLQVEDEAANFTEVTFNVEVMDNTNPVISSTHENQTLSANDTCGAGLPDYTTNVEATDNCTAPENLLITQTPAAGTTVYGAANQVLLSVEDVAGNSAEITFNVIVEDVDNPTIACLGDQEVIAAENQTYTVQGTEFDPVSTHDNCEVTNIENSYNSAATLDSAQLPIGKTTITWTVSDNAGNDNTCSFNVYVENYIEIDCFSENCISIYPNPFSDELIIDAEGYNDKIGFEIFNAIGDVVLIGQGNRV